MVQRSVIGYLWAALSIAQWLPFRRCEFALKSVKAPPTVSAFLRTLFTHASGVSCARSLLTGSPPSIHCGDETVDHVLKNLFLIVNIIMERQ